MQNRQMPATDWQKAKKVDAVKNIIRSHQYTDTMRIFNECASQGFVVSFSALARFAAKLEMADRIRESKSATASDVDEVQLFDTGASADVANKVEYLFNGPTDKIPPAPAHVKAQKQAKLAKAQQREKALVMELGELRVEEHKLMKEIKLIREVIKHLS